MQFVDHLERFWPDSAHDDLISARGTVERVLPGFRVRRIAPQSSGKPWVYATSGASLAVREGEEGAEYIVLAPAEDPVLVEMLAALATVNADPKRAPRRRQHRRARPPLDRRLGCRPPARAAAVSGRSRL